MKPVLTKSLLLLLASLLLSACAPTLRSVGTTVSRGVSGEAVVFYEAAGWEIVTALIDAAPRMQPSAAHTNYFTDNISDVAVTLSSRPLSGGTNVTTLQTANAIAIKLKVTTLDKGDYVQVSFNPEPSNHKDARDAQSAIIAMLDTRFTRHSN